MTDMVDVSLDYPIWDRFFSVAPLIVVGTAEEGGYDLAPKHMAMPVGHGRHYAFGCTPRHRTYGNVKRTGCFTVSFPRPSQVLISSLAAAPHVQAESSDASLKGVPVEDARTVEGVVLAESYAWLECRLDRVVDGFGDASIIVGEVVCASIAEDVLRQSEVSDEELIGRSPLLAYLHPGRFAEVRESRPFPFPEGFSR
jgi:flavin reductase (DIM6/NTAB) family NADH-FMN oxidoreductase RutF